MIKDKVFAIILEEILLAGMLAFFWNNPSWHVTTPEILLTIAFFGITIIIARAIETIISKVMFSGLVKIDIKKSTWVIFRTVCAILILFLFSLAGYTVTLCMGSNPLIIRYGMVATFSHYISSYYFNSTLGIGPVSPFDLEFWRSME